jgi:hypothetical protein
MARYNKSDMAFRCAELCGAFYAFELIWHFRCDRRTIVEAIVAAAAPTCSYISSSGHLCDCDGPTGSTCGEGRGGSYGGQLSVLVSAWRVIYKHWVW